DCSFELGLLVEGFSHLAYPGLLLDRDRLLGAGDLPLDPEPQDLTLAAKGLEDRLSRHTRLRRDFVHGRSRIARGGEQSARRAEWLDDARQAAPRARFRGRNAANKLSRWSRICEVLTADPGHEFSFRTVPAPTKPDSTVWRYRFEPARDGTNVTESYEVVKL